MATSADRLSPLHVHAIYGTLFSYSECFTRLRRKPRLGSRGAPPNQAG